VSEVDQEFEGLLEFVRDTRGFDYTGYRRPTLTRRFEKRMQAVGASDWREYRKYLEEHPEEFNELFNAILINVTGFFRDKETWDLVATEVIPQLLEAREPDGTIRVWSAGCASGEEPYTISMLLAEALGDEAFKARVKIYATDVDDDALTEAREAGYTAKQLEEVPSELREKYFQPGNGGYAFRHDLRRSVIFGRNDLHKDPPISRVDLLVSRNTLMYFSPEIQERILANFHFALRARGFLVVGKAEALQKGRRLFAPYNLKRRVFVKDGTVEPGFRMPHLGFRLDREPLGDDERDLGEAAFEHSPVAQLLVDSELRIAAINQSARAMFGLKLRDVGRPLQDLEISYRPLELRSLIGEVRAHQKPVQVKNVEWNAPRGGMRFLDVQLSPLGLTTESYVGVSIAFADVTLHRTLEDDLERARRELEAAYEELQSTVEELETTNEELQSTNEELETTNEELQSTNEELETMNEELQSTNEELETMNDELRERTDETLRANAFLASVLSSVHQAVVVVDREFRVLAWNRLATELLGLLNDEVEGELLLNLDVGLPVGELRRPLARILANQPQPDLTLEGHNRRGQAVTYQVQLAPLVGSAADEVTGAILLLTAKRRD
jgi:two-component system, chemotaxis family, CheB/CheR fusion protein